MKIAESKKIFLLCAAIFCLAVTAGCGYTSSSLLPEYQKSIYVRNFTNNIDLSREISDRRNSYSYRAGMENSITRAVIDAFVRDRQLDLYSKDNASLTLTGELVDFRQSPLSYGGGGDSIEEFRMDIVVNISLYDNVKDEMIWEEKGFRGQSSYTVSGPNRKTQSQALQAAVKDLAKRIVERTVENW